MAFHFKGSNHKSAARLMWEADQKRLAERKARKSAQKQIRKREGTKCPAGRRAHHIKRCMVLSGETPKEAKERSMTETRLPMQQWYREIYLKSRHWATLKAQAFDFHGRFCHSCRQPAKTIDAHHITYRNIFDVEVTDLHILCRACHDREHEVASFPKVERPGRYRCASEQPGTDLWPPIV